MTRVLFHTFGCKANQYDSERMRQEAEARGARAVADPADADVFVVNTCTVTNQADADARRYIRRVHREHPDARIVVAGCSAALKAPTYRAMSGVTGVIEGHDPVSVARELVPTAAPSVVQIGVGRSLGHDARVPVGSELLARREGATRGWLKVQDGCDRQCGFCATRLARGASRSREPNEVVAEARLLARAHPELVITGIHIGHYGRDLSSPGTLSLLLAHLLDEVPDVRFRLGSVEATEVDDLLLELLATSGGRVAPHLHMPLQSGADPVLRRMRRWHTREGYRRRALQIASRLPVLGLGADVITGFPGETDADHDATALLVEELPYTYLHVFPFSPRDGTHAAELHRTEPVPQRVAAERSQDLRTRVQRKADRYHAARSGGSARVALEGRPVADGPIASGPIASGPIASAMGAPGAPGALDASAAGAPPLGLTEDYLRVRVLGGAPANRQRLHSGVLESRGGHLYIELSRSRSERAEAPIALAPVPAAAAVS